MHNQTRLEERWAALERFVWEELERTRVWALTAGTRDETVALLVEVRRRIQRAIVFAAAGQWGAPGEERRCLECGALLFPEEQEPAPDAEHHHPTFLGRGLL